MQVAGCCGRLRRRPEPLIGTGRACHCSPQGARGVTKDGVSELCALVGGDNGWRPA